MGSISQPYLRAGKFVGGLAFPNKLSTSLSAIFSLLAFIDSTLVNTLQLFCPLFAGAKPRYQPGQQLFSL